MVGSSILPSGTIPPSPLSRALNRSIFCAAISLLTPALACAELVDVPDLGVRLERGFRITQISDEQLANDIWCMTLHPRGDVVVSGPGYITYLRDTNGDGRLDQSTKFADSKGAMGLCFDETGQQLLVMSDGWLLEYRDANLDGVADGAPRKILPFAGGEHGGHAIRRGPDGWWWVIGGNDAGIGARHQTRAGTALPTPRPFTAGAIVRIAPDFKESEIWADGLRNPYDFDFNSRGDVFTYDSDCERDYFLPWYSGCRVYQVLPGRHHGWRLSGYQRSFRVPDYLPETVPSLVDLGRGSPTGVHVYRGTAYPPAYRDALFIGDWTFGRLHYLPLVREGHRYATRPEVFLEPIGSAGFAPTDLVETKDGALLVSIGGRKTRGSIYRIEATSAAPSASEPILAQFDPPSPAVLQDIASAQNKLGGWNLHKASGEAFVPYEPANAKGLTDEERKAATTLAENELFSLDDRVLAEAARLLAMLEDDSTRNADNILARITEKSAPTADFHFLACLSRLKAEPAPERTKRLAHAILDLDRKLAGGDRRPKQMWPVRLNEIVARLISKNSELPKALLAHPGFATAGHLPLAEILPNELMTEVAKKYRETIKADPNFEWTPELVKLFGDEPSARPLLRAQWKNLGLRPALREALRHHSTEEDLVLLAEKESAPVVEDPAAAVAFAESLKSIAWEHGDAARGEKYFRERACVTCHGGTSPIGPDLSGPVARLSAPDLLVDVQFPNRAIADAFRTTLFTLKDGSQRNGFIVFTSADGVMVQIGPGLTERLPQSDIALSEPGKLSLMPPSLLSGLTGEQLADLYAYLRTLRK